MDAVPLLRIYMLQTLFELVYSVFQSIEVHAALTSPPTPLLTKERGDEAQLYRGEVKLYLSCLGNAILLITYYLLLITCP